ncbi:MAG: ribosome maturation factor RimP [Thermodesulfobacteriota bacterium]|nr:ribosome maturation factor RimP [Thermodesulfobacteriota bacterium]
MRPSASKAQTKIIRPRKTGLSQAQIIALTDLTWKLGEPLCTAEGMELIHVECRFESRGQVLRLYIDKPGGVRLDDCMNISRQIGDLIDVHADNETDYLLEVSSPGPDRPLGKPGDFNRFIGHQTQIRTTAPINGQHNLTGILTGMEDEIVTLRMENTSITIPFSQIKHARLIGYQGES